MSVDKNRLHNATNPNQGKSLRVLCVCSAGLLRSPTAAVVLQREFGHNTRACGAEDNFALVPVDGVLIHWADEIVCMNSRHEETVRAIAAKQGIDTKHTTFKVLNIPDQYEYMDKGLQSIILERYNKWTPQ